MPLCAQCTCTVIPAEHVRSGFLTSVRHHQKCRNFNSSKYIFVFIRNALYATQASAINVGAWRLGCYLLECIIENKVWFKLNTEVPAQYGGG